MTLSSIDVALLDRVTMSSIDLAIAESPYAKHHFCFPRGFRVEKKHSSQGRGRGKCAMRQFVAVSVALLLSGGCGSTQSTLHMTIKPNTYGFAVVSLDSVNSGDAARKLVEKGYKVVHGSGVELADTTGIPVSSVLLARCVYLGRTGSGLTGTSANISCVVTDLATGFPVYSGTGKYMGVSMSDDMRGAISRALDPFPSIRGAGAIVAASTLPRSTMPSTTAEPRADVDRPTITSTGTAFYVDARGYLLTNAHVVEGCASLRLRGQEEPVQVVRLDEENDLAVIKVSNDSPAVATFRKGRGVRSGDQVVVVGFPLAGLLASEANVTSGGISALAGVRNDLRYLQITVPVQPGNSGGPLLDSTGRVVGIVTASLDALQMVRSTGDLPQNINFALHASVARILMDAADIGYATSGAGEEMSVADVGEAAKEFTVLVECWR